MAARLRGCSVVAAVVAGLLCGLPGSAPFSLSPAQLQMLHPPLSSSLGRFPASHQQRLMRPLTCGARMADAQGDDDESREKSGTQLFTVSKPADGSRSIEAELEFRYPPQQPASPRAVPWRQCFVSAC